MGRTVTMAIALLMVFVTATAGVVSPAAGGAAPVTAGGQATDTAVGGEDATQVDATALPPIPVDNSTARLVVPEDEIKRTGMASVHPDFGAALADAGDDVHRRHGYLTAEVRFDAASSTDERKIIVDQTLIDLKNDAVTMRERQHLAISRYANGTIDESELLRTLARIDRSARRMLETTAYLESKVDRIGLINRIYGVEAILETLKGPVRKEVRQTLRGASETNHFYVEATDTALVLSTVDGEGTFLREAYVPSNRGEGPSREIDKTWQALELSAEYYPWAENNTAGFARVDGLDDVYVTKRPHVQGQTVAYLDAYSSDVFYEIQQLEVDAMPNSLAYNATTDGFEIVVHRTYPGGPMLVGVYDQATGNPVNARVSVAGVEIGPTDADGFVRVVEPQTEYEISVSTPRASANVTVDPRGED